MAFAYAQIRSAHARKPLIEMVQDGIILSTLADASDQVLSETAVVSAVASSLGLSIEESGRIVGESVARLEGRSQAVKVEGKIGLVEEYDGTLESRLADLATSVLDRMRVREQVRVNHADHTAAASVLEGVSMSRAWDVAAHFAGSSAGWGSDLPQVIKQLVASELKKRTISAPGAMERALINLLTSPEDRESEMLSEIGRAAFGVQLVIATPRQALFRKYSLPEKIYLDANVLMPAIVPGHPLRTVYVDSLKQLSDASDTAGVPLKVSVGLQFLNEIVSHRAIAREVVAQLGDANKIMQHVRFNGATNTNVFVAAYASFLAQASQHVQFSEFLNGVAPYTTEDELAEYLSSVGIAAEEMDYQTVDNHIFVEVFNQLLESYEVVSELKARKQRILIRHEAEQIVRLRLDQERGTRSIFVTADQGFRRALQRDLRLHRYAGLAVSHIGLAALVDVLVGLQTDNRVLARLLWAPQRSEQEQAIFEYLVRLGIENYEEGIAMEMQAAAQAVASRAAQRADRDRVPLFGKDPTDVATTAEFLDRYQDMFFRYWREAVEKREESAGAS